MEKENVAGIAEATSDYYEIMCWAHVAAAGANWWNAWGWWNYYAAYEWYAGADWIDNDSERVWNHIVGSSLVGTQCFQVPHSFCQYTGAGCDDTPGQWANCRLECTSGTTTTCVQVHSNGQSDGWIPATSQRGDGSNSWRVLTTGGLSDPVVKMEALGVNHFEELDATNDVMRSVFGRVFSGQDWPVFRIDTR